MEIHIRLAGEEIGPFSETQIRQYMGEGLVSPSDMAMSDEMTDWQSVETLLASLPPSVYSTPVFSDPEPVKEHPAPPGEATKVADLAAPPAAESKAAPTIPKETERIEYGGRRFTITKMDRNRIASVTIEKLDQKPPPDSQKKA